MYSNNFILLIYLKLVFSFAPVSARTSSETYRSRIVGGEHKEIDDYPHTVVVHHQNHKLSCSGAIIGPKWMITSGSCYFENEITKVYPGTKEVVIGWDFCKVGRQHRHPKYYESKKYNATLSHYDFALMELEKYMEFGIQAKAVVLGTQGDITQDRNGSLSGFGVISKDSEIPDILILRAVNLPIITYNNCKNVFYESYIMPDHNVFCAGFVEAGQGSCRGDVGGPFVVRRGPKSEKLLIGILSISRGCGTRRNSPLIMASIPFARDWILNVTGI